MHPFLQSAGGAFVGKILAAIFIAVCVAVGFGPDAWATFLLGDLSLLAHIISRISFLLLGITVLCFIIWPKLRRWWRRLGFRWPVTFHHQMTTEELSNPSQEGEIRLEILSPTDGDTVDLIRTVRGSTTQPGAPLQLLVLSPDKKWYPQRQALVDGRSWIAECQFGNQEKGRGEPFKIIAIMPEEPIRNAIETIPANSVKSKIVSVIRSALPNKTLSVVGNAGISNIDNGPSKILVPVDIYPIHDPNARGYPHKLCIVVKNESGKDLIVNPAKWEKRAASDIAFRRSDYHPWVPEGSDGWEKRNWLWGRSPDREAIHLPRDRAIMTWVGLHGPLDEVDLSQRIVGKRLGTLLVSLTADGAVRSVTIKL
jgi:hypothetical protein